MHIHLRYCSFSRFLVANERNARRRCREVQSSNNYIIRKRSVYPGSAATIIMSWSRRLNSSRWEKYVNLIKRKSNPAGIYIIATVQRATVHSRNLLKFQTLSLLHFIAQLPLSVRSSSWVPVCGKSSLICLQTSSN